MLKGCTAEEIKALQITKAEDYRYLTIGNCLTIPGEDEAEEWRAIRGAMKILKFDDNDQWNIFSQTAAVLTLGNVTFAETEVDNIKGAEITSKQTCAIIANLLGVELAGLMKGLVTKTTFARGEVIVSKLKLDDAEDVRDAFAKGIYGKVFIWIVGKINKTTFKPQAESNDPSVYRTSIGVLDIFGFECFEVNSFEQLCINWCNECLQQFFVQHIFKMEQQEYDKEGIDWKKIEFTDNQPTLDMIAYANMSLVALIDEESKFPKGTDSSMLEKLNGQHQKNPLYILAKGKKASQFGIKHFAGEVYYESKGFLDRNRDTFSNDLLALCG
jgi:myosin-7